MADSSGINRYTGQPLTDWEHTLQSLEVIFTTEIGERWMLRHFGSSAPILLGRLLTAKLVIVYYTLISLACELWEPRFRVSKLDLVGTPEDIRMGHVKILIQGAYRPRALQGDYTVDLGGGKRRVYAFSDGSRFRVVDA